MLYSIVVGTRFVFELFFFGDMSIQLGLEIDV